MLRRLHRTVDPVSAGRLRHFSHNHAKGAWLKGGAVSVVASILKYGLVVSDAKKTERSNCQQTGQSLCMQIFRHTVQE